jgi:hypothetical protein
MKRLSSILNRAKSAKDNISEQATSKINQTVSPQTKNQFKNMASFIKENQIPRYVIYGIIAVKLFSIYDKTKQMVAINLTQTAVLREHQLSMSKYI